MGRPLRAIPALFALLLIMVPAAAASGRVLRYHGHELSVPRGWPVYDLARHPQTCVRRERAAVYRGDPSPAERCPAHAVGRNRAVVIEPRGARSVVLHGTRAAAPTGGGAPSTSARGSGAAGSGAAGATFTGLGFDAC